MSELHHKPAFERSSDEKKKRILETGINEFSTYGFDGANINVIAKKAGISIGLMYKYFDTKEDFFITCMDETIRMMEEVISDIVKSDDKILIKAEKIIRAIQATSGADSNYVKLYNEITKLSSSKHVEIFAKRIEEVSANAYRECIRKAKESGDIRNDCDESMFAFFFDSILTTLQFSYTCDYYRERFKIFCGVDIFDDDEKVVQELVKFLESAFTFSHMDVESSK